MQALGNVGRDMLCLSLHPRDVWRRQIQCSADSWQIQRTLAKCIILLDCFGTFFSYVYLSCSCLCKRTSFLEVLSTNAVWHTRIKGVPNGGNQQKIFFSIHGGFTPNLQCSAQGGLPRLCPSNCHSLDIPFFFFRNIVRPLPWVKCKG